MIERYDPHLIDDIPPDVEMRRHICGDYVEFDVHELYIERRDAKIAKLTESLVQIEAKTADDPDAYMVEEWYKIHQIAADALKGGANG
jgi:hypothetical protein